MLRRLQIKLRDAARCLLGICAMFIPKRLNPNFQFFRKINYES